MRARNGMVLMEVMVALAILAGVGAAFLGVAMQSMDRMDQARKTEQSFLAAENLLSAVSLWNRQDLDRRLGERPQGVWRLTIEREGERLYWVTIRDSTGALVLATALHRQP